MNSRIGKIRRSVPVVSWALYDLANQFFALNVVSLYFPRWVTIEKQSPEIFYSLTFGISMFFVALCAPLLGTLSDMRKRHKPFLVFLTLLSVLFTIGLGLPLNIFFALVLFAIANFGCQAAVIFYNALMVKVAPRGKVGLISGLGRMFGYSGAILALLLTKPVIAKMGYQATFFLTGISFLVFSLPCMLFVKEDSSPLKDKKHYFLKKEEVRQIFQRLKVTIGESYRSPQLGNFLKASFFGLCVVNTVILFMSVYASKALGLGETEIINLIAFSTLFAIVGSIVFGFISDKIGYRTSLTVIFFFWGVCILGGALVHPPFHWLIGAVAGFSLGSTWVVLRALVVNLVPEEKIGEIFGLFNLVAYASGIVGPLFWGVILLYFSQLGAKGYRLAFLALIVFIAIGGAFLLKMPKEIRKRG